ncbi:MAG: M56 family metallopeptidase, partial [Verrucomicrobiales bacterium]
MNRFLLSFAALLSALLPLILDSALKGAVLLAVAAFAALALSKASAATRHLVWLVAVVALLAVPVLSVALPEWRILPTWEKAPVESVSAASERTSGTHRIDASDPSPVLPATHPTQAALPIVEVPPVSVAAPSEVAVLPVPAARELAFDWLPLAWGAGFVLLVLRLVFAHLLLRRSARHCLIPATDHPVAAAFASTCSELGIRQRLTLLLDRKRTIPVVWGVLHPQLLLPSEADQWSAAQLRSVLLHELAHLKRRDPLVQWLTQIACAFHWWNPLVWFAAWRIHVERERACDDLVLASGVRPSAYAEHLLNVATKLSPAPWTKGCGLAMARKSSLEGRLTAVLSEKLNRRGITRALTAAALILGTLIAIPLAMLRAAEENWDPPSGAHIGGNDFSTFCIHDGKDATFVIAYHGDFDSTSRSSSNAKERTWNNDVTLTAKNPGIALSFHRTHTAPGKLSITTAPAEGRDLNKPAPPPRDFGHMEYDLAKGRVFLLTDTGLVRQFDLPTPVVTDQESAKKLAALIAAIPPQEQETEKPMNNTPGKLLPETIAKLKWGEPVNGLRMALAWPPSFDDDALGKKPHFELVVQNVSKKAVWLTAGDAAPNPRRLTLQDATPVARTVDDVPIPGDWLLQPREVAFVRLFHSEQKFEDGKTLSALKEHVVSVQPQYSYMADMTIGKAPAGAWTGKLVTGATRGSADKADAPAPIHKDARALYENWQRLARADGDIPGALVGELAAAVNQFIKYNPTWETVPQLNAILPRLDATRDWKAADVVALLDEMGAIKDAPFDMASWRQRLLRKGEKLPEKFADAEWSGDKAGGLRVAWVLEPGAAEHRIDTALKARLLVWNTGAVPVMVQVPTWHQGGVTATDAKGAEVQVSGIEWTTLPASQPVRLGPGEFIEIRAPGVGLGKDAGRGPWAGPRVGSNVLTKPGDELTLTHSPVPLDGSEEGIRDGIPPVVGAGWWLSHIKTRLSRELPLPAGAAERTHLLERAVGELFATAPTAEEIAAFTADQTPGALDALAKRLAERPDAVEFAGK